MADSRLGAGRRAASGVEARSARRFERGAGSLPRRKSTWHTAGYATRRPDLRAGQPRSRPQSADRRKRTARLRRLALEWLRTDFALWRQRAKGASASQRLAVLSSLNQWLTHDDLIGVRDEKARRKLLEDGAPTGSSSGRKWPRSRPALNHVDESLGLIVSLELCPD